MQRCSKKSRSGPGFTLIELLVVIAIIAVLIAITAPAIGRAVIASRETVLLSRLRGITQATEAYVGDHRFLLPQAGISYEREFSIDTGAFWYGYFAQSGFWTVALWPYFGEPNHPGMHDPWGNLPEPNQQWHGPSSFQHNAGMYSQPRYWSPTDPILDDSQLIAPKASDVAFPSAKVAFFHGIPSHLLFFQPDAEPPSEPPPFPEPVALADASAHLIPRADLPPAVSDPSHTGQPATELPDAESSRSLIRTINGVLGRDL